MTETTSSEIPAADVDGRHKTIGPPSKIYAALESRAFAERMQMAMSMPMLRLLPPGDGHSVIVYPGFTAGDRSTSPLRRVLRSLGYRVHGWGGGTNVGPTNDALRRLVERLDEVHRRSDGPVSLIGWSLGGIYARELARAFPQRVRQVITLGSPIQMTADDRSGAQPVWNALRHLHAPGFVRETREFERPRLRVPATSIYSRTDGVVNWPACLIRRTDRSENIRVYGSHCGLGYNVAAAYAIADRLAQPPGQWMHFSAPFMIKSWFPPVEDLDRDRLAGGVD